MTDEVADFSRRPFDEVTAVCGQFRGGRHYAALAEAWMLPHLRHAKIEFSDDLATLPDGRHQYIWRSRDGLRRILLEIRTEPELPEAVH